MRQKSVKHNYLSRITGNKWRTIYISIAGGILLLNSIAWNSTAFCDAYIAYVFPVWVNTYGCFMGHFPFSVGEWMILAGLALLALFPVMGILKLCGRLVKYTRLYFRFLSWTLLAVCGIMTLNCTMLYHGSTFSQKYYGDESGEDTLEELIKVYNDVATHCNALSKEMERDADGTILYSGSVNAQGQVVDMEDKAIEVMQNLGKSYPQLDGYYPRPKPMLFSDFMCQEYMCGYYFPFSMEANYNAVMYVMNQPAAMCHELAHLRGYIYEDEANFIAFLACTQSDDKTFQYAGYLSVLNYLANDLYHARLADPEGYQRACESVRPLRILAVVQEDNVFVTEEEWNRINGKALIHTETVDQVSDTLTDASLKLNGVEDGMISYNRVVNLLLQYYRVSGEM